jgi:hypothetical protein
MNFWAGLVVGVVSSAVAGVWRSLVSFSRIGLPSGEGKPLSELLKVGRTQPNALPGNTSFLTNLTCWLAQSVAQAEYERGLTTAAGIRLDEPIEMVTWRVARLNADNGEL